MVIEYLEDEEAEAPKETYIEFLEEERPARLFPEPSVAIEPEETGTSFAKEFQQLGPAFIESAGRPLESMGETADILGFSDIGQALKGAIQEPENYESASARFAEPKPGDASFLGFAWQYAPRAITEQAGQLVGSIATRAGGAILGAPLGPKGVLAGAFVGPAIFEAAQIIGPVAKERAKNNGRDVPNSNDIAVATVTAAGSGALNAIGARYLPGGEKATGKFFKRVAAGFIGEAPTEATQAIVQQSGETAFTEKGLEINPKSALAEGLIGGGAGSTINAIVYPFAKKTPDNAKITSKEGAEEMDIEGKANIEAINLMTTPDDLETKKNLSKIKELESYKASNEILLKSLGADDPEAQKLIDENAAIDNEISQIRTNIERSIGLVEETKETALAAQMMERSNQIDAIKKEIEDDELGLQAIEEGTPERQQAEMSINDKKQNLVRLEEEFNKLSAAPKAAPKREETQTKEQVTARIEELNNEFDALDENDTAGQDRVNRELFAEQNKLAALTAVEQGIEPQATTPTRAAARPPSGREYPYGTFYPERPILNAFVKQADKAIGAIKVAGKRAQKLKNAIRTSVTKNAGFLAGIGANVVSSEEFARISGRKPVTADSGTYMAAYSGGKLYLVLPDVNQLTGMAIAGEKRAASKDAALDQESRAASKKLEEEMIHLSMYKAIQEEYAKQKKPKLTEQEFMVQRITQIAREVRRTNPDVVPNVSQVYLGKIQNLDDVTLSMEFMRMVIQRVRTGQITEDLNAIRAAEREAFTDKSRTAISQFKNAILNALQMLRNSLVRYLGKGTSTREVKKMEDTINAILDEYGIVGGEANYEFKDYSAAQPTRAAAPEAAVTTTQEAEAVTEPAAEPVSSTITARAGVTPQMNDRFVGLYEAALRGDKKSEAEAQKMVDAAARAAGYNSPRLFHGSATSESKFTSFLKEKLGLATGAPSAKKGFFFTTRKKTAEFYMYAGNFLYTKKESENLRKKNAKIISEYKDILRRTEELAENFPEARERILKDTERMRADIERMSKELDEQPLPQRYEVYLSLKNPLVKDFKGSVYREESYNNLLKKAKEEGRDGAIFKNTYDAGETGRLDAILKGRFLPEDIYVVFEPEQIKSAEPFTFFDKEDPMVTSGQFKEGALVPLSMRFDPSTTIIARAGIEPTPEAAPRAAQPRAASVQRKLTDDMVSQIEGMIEQIKPRRSRAGKEYVSRTTTKGKTYPAALVSPYSLGVNLYTSNTSEEAAKALTKIFKNNPDADFFSVASDIGNGLNRFNLSQSEIASITPMIYKLMPAYREQIMDSSASAKDRESIALNSLDVEANLAKLIVDQQQGSARTLNAAKTVRQIGSAGTAVAAYKSRVVASLADLYTIVKGNFTEVAEAVRGDRRQAIDNVFALKGVISRITELRKIAEKNPQAAADAIRNAVAKKKTRKAREIVLEFCASIFDLGGDKYANMMVDETAKAIMSIGAARKGFSPDDVYKYVYQAFSAVAKQTAREIEEKGKPAKEKVKKKREGKFLAQVKSVIGNDNDYKLFIAELKKKIGEQYSDKREFENDYKELFSMLADRQWSDAMRNQAIKDSADFLEYKFSDLITYIGENRYAAQAAVTAHIKAELKGVGATDEQVEKFISETQAYLDEETSKRVKKSLGFEVNKETGKITGGKIEKEAMKKVATAEERFKLATTLKGLTKLAASDYRAFVDKLNELIILELGFDEKTSNELSKLIESEMTKAVQAQRSINLEQAIQRAQEKLSQNNIKPKANQRTLLQRLMEMANMGQLDDLGVYEAFRQTHNFQEGYLEWSPEFAQTLREWGDRISALPEGVTRAIEEQKMGRFLLQKQGFTTRDYFSSYWYFALLSQVGTQAVNFLGSTFNLLGNMAVWSIYTKGKATGPMLRALYSATIRKEAPARNSFAYVMQTGLNPSGIQDDKLMKYPKLNVLEGASPENTPKFVYGLTTYGDGKIEAIPRWLNSVLTTISPRGLMRVMRATDAFMREAAYEVRAASFGAKDFEVDTYEAAKRQAEAELASSKSRGKLKEREIIIRANEIYAKQRLGDQKRIDAERDALESVYSQEPVGVVGFIASLGNKLLQVSPITQLFIPFTNVVANVLNENLNYLPYVSAARLAPYVKLSPLLRGKIELKPGAEKSEFILGREEKAADIAIKGMIGTAAFALPAIVTALLGGDDEDQESRPPVQFYATGPADPEQNKIWRENGGSNYSIRVGDKYVSYLYTPLVIPIAAGSMFADAVKRYREKQEKQPIEITDAALTVIAAPFAIGFVAALDQSFLTGVADLIELKEARDLPKDATRIASNIISRLVVPGQLRDFQKIITDEKLEGDTRLSNLIREMPGSSFFLDKKLGYFGDPVRYNSIMVENGPGRRALSLVGRIASSETPDPAFSVLYRNGLIPPKWQGSLEWSSGVRMTLAEQREFVRIAGPLMKEWVIDNADTLDELPTEEAQEYLANNLGEIRRGVKSQLQMDKEIPFE
jgi:hypothetical protein